MECEEYEHMDDEFSKFRRQNKKTAEEWAAEAMAADMDQWLIYSPNKTGETVDEWLQRYPPSQISRQDGIGWISIKRPGSPAGHHPDVVSLQQSWEELQGSGRPINLQTITELAMMHQATAGKWLLHVDTGLKVDTIWAKVAHGIWNGILPHSAKISPFSNDEANFRHVICIYNLDYTKQDEVYALDAAIRSIGIKAKMTYKPDVYTYVGIYKNNQWGLRPSIYESMYDLLKGCSIVKPVDPSLQ